MKWQGRRGSDNVEDRRRMSGGGKTILGGGVSGIIILGLIWMMGGNPMEYLGMLNSGGGITNTGAEYKSSAEEDALAQFVSVTLADTEEVWTSIFQSMGRTYSEPGLVIFHRSVSSACGSASDATGPFYCPGDQKVYIDLSFYNQMQGRLKAGGDFALAYVIAHEVGHHVQKLLGTLDQVNAMQSRLSERERNALNVRLELQADFYAGVWARHAEAKFGSLEDGDIEEALNAASAVGDDRLQQQSQGMVVPDSFTHGSSAQRYRWFKKGYETGDITQGDTFSANSL